jgi:hypothetical protein
VTEWLTHQSIVIEGLLTACVQTLSGGKSFYPGIESLNSLLSTCNMLVPEIDSRVFHFNTIKLNNFV